MKSCRWNLFIALLLGMITASCGGGSGGGGIVPPPPPAPLTITTTVLPSGVSGKPYVGAQLQATGGTAPYSWSSPSPITGLTVSSDGKIAGSLNVSWSVANSMEVDVQDSAGQKAKKTLSINVNAPISISLSGTNSMTSGTLFQGAIFAIPGDSSLHTTIKIVAGSLPPGLSLGTQDTQSIGVSGTPTKTGIFAFTVEATSNGTPPETEQAQLTYYVDVIPLVWYDPADLYFAKRTVAYQAQVAAVQGGTAPYTFVLAPDSNSMPPGLTLGTSGTISGTPTAVGSYSFTVRVSDSSATYPQTLDKTFNLKVIEPLAVSGTLPDATTGESYSPAALTITGGTPPYTLYGTYFSSCCFTFEQHDMTIHGVPYTPGTQSITYSLHDSIGQYLTQTVNFNVIAGPFRSSPDLLPSAKVGQLYYGYMNSISGKSPLTWKLASGTFPPGLSLNFNPAPYLYGYPTTPGTYQFTLEATDSSGTPQVLDLPETITVYSKLPRNDSIAGATNYYTSGFQNASISPYADPPDIPNPDQDYIHVRAFAGQTISIDVHSMNRIMDPVVEILDVNGHRFSSCRDPQDDDPSLPNADPTPLGWDDACLNDDILTGVYTDSHLDFRVPGASGSMVDFYFHILDFQGNARPDMTYSYFIASPVSVK